MEVLSSMATNNMTSIHGNGGQGNQSVYTYYGDGVDDDGGDYDFNYVMKGMLVPAIALFGVFGNLLNLVILSWRCNKRETDVLERGALLGLIALAVSDCCFCIAIFPNAICHRDRALFFRKDFEYYYKVYGLYVINSFIKISTWLTMIIASARYVAICHPLRARIFVGLRATKIAITLTYLLWFALSAPLLWTFKTENYNDKGRQVYITDIGIFTTNTIMRLTFTYVWAVVGYFVPIIILAFCNINLIRALRESAKWRETSTRSQPGRDANLKITLTLVALIVMFIILMSPSELLHFLLHVINTDTLTAFEIATNFTNVLQALNFACHFVLYCAVNVTFRRTISNVFYMLLAKVRGGHTLGRACCNKTHQYQAGTRSMSRGGASFKSTETRLETNL